MMRRSEMRMRNMKMFYEIEMMTLVLPTLIRLPARANWAGYSTGWYF